MGTEEEAIYMVMKHYPAGFKADAVALYRSRPRATFAEIANELGVNRETLRNWIRTDDAERSWASAPAQRRPTEAASAGEPLEQENKRLRAQVAELEKEREILRKAAAYFAGEMLRAGCDGASQTWEGGETCTHRGNTPMSCVNALPAWPWTPAGTRPAAAVPSHVWAISWASTARPCATGWSRPRSTPEIAPVPAPTRPNALLSWSVRCESCGGP